MTRRCLLFILCLVLVPGAALADRLADVLARGELRAGVKDTMPPFGFRDPDSGAIKGFEPDLVRAVAERLGVEARLSPVSSGTRIQSLVEGRLDLVAATMEHTLSRDEIIDFSVAYFQDGVRLLVPAGSGVNGPADMDGRTVAVMAGDTAEKAVPAALPGCRITPVEGFAQAFVALKQGRADALAADAGMLLFLRNADPEPGRWAIVGRAVTRRPVAMGLPENESGLRDAVNRALIELWHNGRFRRIFTHWFGPKTPHHLPLDWAMETWPP